MKILDWPMYLTKVGKRLEWVTNDPLISASERDRRVPRPQSQLSVKGTGLLTNLQSIAHVSGKSEIEAIVTLIKNQWQVSEIINRGDVAGVEDYGGIQQGLRRLIEWAFQPEANDLLKIRKSWSDA